MENGIISKILNFSICSGRVKDPYLINPITEHTSKLLIKSGS